MARRVDDLINIEELVRLAENKEERRKRPDEKSVGWVGWIS